MDRKRIKEILIDFDNREIFLDQAVKEIKALHFFSKDLNLESFTWGVVAGGFLTAIIFITLV